MRTRTVTVAFTAVLALLLTGCAGEPGGDPEPTPSQSTGTAGPTPSLPIRSPSPPPESPIVPPPVVPPRSDKPGLTTLTGQAYAGVEAGCVLLQTSSGDYLLIGEAASQVRMGATVTVRGQVRANLATTCQQGTPFEVSEVED